MATLRVEGNDTEASADDALQIALTGVQAGDLLVVFVRERDGTSLGATPITDTVNGTTGWVVGPDVLTDPYIRSFYNLNSGAGDPTIEVDFTGNITGQAWGAAFAPAAGGNTWSLEDSDTQTNASGTAHNADNVTLSGTGVLAAGNAHSGDSGGETIGDGYTAATMAAGEREYHRYKLSSGETADAHYTTTNSISSVGVHLAFLETAAGGGSAVPVKMGAYRRRRQ